MSRSVQLCPKILSFGEILWDVFGAREVIGGAPFNVASHLTRLGMRSFIYSRVGGDARGIRARQQVARFGLVDRWLQHDDIHATGWVDVALDASGQPAFQIGAHAAWDHIEAPTPSAVRELQAEGFSALVCGTLALRSPVTRSALAAVRAALPGVPVFYDVNLRGRETPIERVRDTLPGVTLLKVNTEEARQIAQGVCGESLEPPRLFARLRQQYGIAVMLCTHGEDGCEVLTAEGTFASRPERVKVASAVGAGDAFSAAFLASWVKGLPLDQAAGNANILGAYVAASPETVPDYSAALLGRLHGLAGKTK